MTGRVEVDSSASADVATRSGRITLGDVGGNVRAHCVSGRVDIHLTSPGNVDAESVTGHVSVTLPPQVDVQRLEARPVSSSWPDGTACRIDARSVTGRVDVSVR